MDASNLSVLDRNIIHAFGVCDYPAEVEAVYLAKRDKMEPLEAERAAYQWGVVCRVAIPAIKAAEALYDGIDHGVTDYVRTRFLNMDNG
jgi:hypothetical protein